MSLMKCAASWVLACLTLHAQTSDPRPSRPDRFVNKESVDKALSKLKTGTIEGVDMELLGKAEAVEAIPYLEKQFARIDVSFPNAGTDEAMSEAFGKILDKAKIAQGLVKLGDSKEQYWTYLAEHVKPGLESTAPDPFVFDAKGKVTGSPSPEYAAWVSAHGPKAEMDVYMLPGWLILLGATGDLRAVPYLRQALDSQNYAAQAMAAEALVALKDKDAIPFIIEAARRAPSEPGRSIAEALLYFDDPAAQSAFDEYVPKDRAKMLRESKAKGQMPLDQ